MKRPLLLAAAVATGWSVVACYPNRLDTTNYDAVATLFDTTATFQATTFSLPDSVVHLVPPGEIDDIPHALDPVIIAEIRDQMEDRGYTFVADPNVADLNLLPAVSTTEYQGYYWDYWCGYWGWYYPYGCYGGGAYYYEYTVGSLFVGMHDRRDLVANDARIIWLAIGNGIAGVGTTSTRVINAIQQMFAQSPYINAN